jgi:hypothetical protein
VGIPFFSRTVIQDAGWAEASIDDTAPFERVVAAVLGGASCREAAARFDAAVSSVVRLMQRYRATGSVVPGKMDKSNMLLLANEGGLWRILVQQRKC